MVWQPPNSILQHLQENIIDKSSNLCKCHMYTGYVYLVIMFIFLFLDYKLIPLLSSFVHIKCPRQNDQLFTTRVIQKDIVRFRRKF